MNQQYHFPALWNDKAPDAIVAERHDVVYLFDATNCNPNGDPDTGNMPRLQPDTLKGLVTDVCLKRKVRNFYARHTPAGILIDEDGACDDRHHLFIREGAVIQRLVEAPSLEDEAKARFLTFSLGEANPSEEQWTKKNKEDKALPQLRDRAYRDALCQAYFDVRYFGAVVSTEGPLKGSFYGQIRGPIQVTFAESLDKILHLDFSITRCAVASEKEASNKDDDNRTMGRKHAVPYGLYRCNVHFSPAFAVKTGFTYADLDNFLFALTRCLGDYNVDGSAARPGGMRVVGLVDFAHDSALGNAPAHKLLDLVNVQGKKDEHGKFLSSGSEFPQSLADYVGSAPDGAIYAIKNEYGVVTECSDEKPERTDGNEVQSAIEARRIIWEF